MFEARASTRPPTWSTTPASKARKILTGGGRSTRFDKGYWFEPTVLREVNGTMKLMTEEPFAPVMPILDFTKLDEVIAAANNTPLRSGRVRLHQRFDRRHGKWPRASRPASSASTTPCPSTPQCPFGGMKESGLGRELGHEGLDAYLETKYVVFRLRE